MPSLDHHFWLKPVLGVPNRISMVLPSRCPQHGNKDSECCRSYATEQVCSRYRTDAEEGILTLVGWVRESKCPSKVISCHMQMWQYLSVEQKGLIFTHPLLSWISFCLWSWCISFLFSIRFAMKYMKLKRNLFYFILFLIFFLDGVLLLLPRLEYNGKISSHSSLHLLGSSKSSASAS